MSALPAAASPEPLVLRDYQERVVADVRTALKESRRVLVVMPTGAGKTPTATWMARETFGKGASVYFNCHRAELIEQTSATWARFGIPHGFIAAGRPKHEALARICSIDTLKNRLLTTPAPKVCIWDECHHLGAAGWQAVMDAWPDSIHIGLTGSPWRLDGSGLGRQFGVMVLGPTPAWLIEHGHLSRYEIFAPNPPDMKGTRRDKEGDFTKRDASARMDMPKRTGDIVQHWRREANGMRTIAFAVNRVDSGMIVNRFNDAGIPAAHLDGDTEKGERSRIIREFAAGRIVVLSNVGLFGEGFDLAAIAQTNVTIDCLIDAAPTNSLAAVLQRWGRVLRPKDYPAIILDHAGNSNRHGFPDDPREWTLADREKSGRGGKSEAGPPPPYTCTCFRQIKRPLPANCPHCDTPLIPDVAPVEEGEGELSRRTAADKAAVRAQLKREEAEAKSLHDLIALANRRGYQNPTGWAFKKFQASKWRKDLAAERAREERAAMTPAERDREDFESEFAGSGCNCWQVRAPCGYCTHPGNPINQEEHEHEVV
jgi:DNA repair protein RadD